MTWQEHTVGTKDLQIESRELDQSWPGLKEYKMVGPIEDKRFGKVNVFEHSQDSHQKLIQLEHSVNSESEAKRILFKCKLRLELNSEFVQNLVAFDCLTKKSLCSKQYLLHLYFEQPDMDLQQRENDLRLKAQWFTPLELNTFKEDILSGLQLLHSNDLVHGNIRPSFVGYCPDQKRFFLLDSYKVSQQFERQ